jgi:hypothetical protein
VIELTYSFDVIHVVLVDASPDSPAIYDINLLQSIIHWKHVLLKVSKDSKSSGIFTHFQFDHSTLIFFVMLAPHCEKDQFIPSLGHSSDFYFAPSFKNHHK